MLYAHGTQRLQGTTLGLAAGLGYGITTANSQSLAAEGLAPPKEIGWWPPCAVLLIGLMLGIANAWFVLLGAILAMGYALYASEYNDKVRRYRMETWNQLMVCNRCGEVFLPTRSTVLNTVAIQSSIHKTY